MALGEVYFHLLPDAAPLDSLAEAAFRRSQALQPEYAPSLFHLIQIAVRHNDLDSAQAMFRRYQAVDPDSAVTFPIRLMLQCATGRMGLSEWKKAAAVSYDGVTDAAHALAAAPRYQRCALDGFRAVLEETTTSGWYHPTAFYAYQAILAGSGRLGDSMPHSTRSVVATSAASGTRSSIPWLVWAASDWPIR